MYLIKQNNGHYIPLDDSDYEDSKKIGIGKVVKVSQARNYEHHKKAMAILNIGFENQEEIEIFDIYRKVITMKAGFYDSVIDKNGNPFPIVRSLKFDLMSQKDFNEFYDSMLIVVAKELKITPEELGDNQNNI